MKNVKEFCMNHKKEIIIGSCVVFGGFILLRKAYWEGSKDAQAIDKALLRFIGREDAVNELIEVANKINNGEIKFDWRAV